MEAAPQPPEKQSLLTKTKGWLGRKAKLVGLLLGALAIGGVVIYAINQPVSAPDAGQLGGPVPGLTPDQLRKFYAAKEIFKKEFTVEEGLGPLFNGKSCFECHGQPGIAGGEGRDTSSTSIINFARRIPDSPKASKPLKEVIQTLGTRDLDLYLLQGGPSLQRRSITTEFPNKYPFEHQINFEQIPVDAELQSNRHSPHLFGIGLIDNIPEGDFVATALKQAVYSPSLQGRPQAAIDRYHEQARGARLGWKDQHVNLLNFTTAAMNIEMGLTTYLSNTENTPTYMGIMPDYFLKRMPESPNDKGKVLLSLVYFQSLLAPPPRGPITEEVKKGEKIFTRLQCAVCHKPDARTLPDAQVPDPDSPVPLIKYIKVPALSNQVFHPYSDFLLHDMGPELADGIPQEGAKGGEFRTQPLWGMSFKKFLMHDGRTSDIHTAIMMHGGQSAEVRDEYAKLSKEDQTALLAFLKSL